MRSLILIILVLSGCPAFQLVHPPRMKVTPTSAPAIDCSKLQTPYLIWGGLAVGFGALAGASGVSTLAPKANSDGSPSKAQLGLAITSVVVGTFSAIATFVAGNYASAYTKCVAQ